MIIVVHLPLLPLHVAMRQAGRDPDEPVALAPPAGAPARVGMCTQAAQAAGIHEGLTVGEAYARCPRLSLVATHPERVHAIAQQLLGALEDAGCAVEELDQHTAAFAAAPLLRLHGGLPGVLRQVRRAIPVGVDGRVGIAPTVSAAHHAARTANAGVAQVIGGERLAAFLAPLPVEALGLATALNQRCRQLGLTTVGHIAALPAAAAQECLGPDGPTIQRIAAGGADRPLRPRTPPQPLKASLDFAEPMALLATLQTAATALLERLLDHPDCRGKAIRALIPAADLVDGGSWAHRIALREATDHEHRLRQVLLPQLERIPAPVAALQLEAHICSAPTGHQLALVASPRAERLARAREALNHVQAVVGGDALLRAVPLERDSHIPERRWMLIPRGNGHSDR